MRRFLLCLSALGLVAVATGCAENAEIHRREAARHEYRAQRAAAYGDYERAAREERRANHERGEAYEEGDYRQPGYVPTPPPPGYYVAPAPVR